LKKNFFRFGFGVLWGSTS